MGFHTIINWTSPFSIKWLLGGVFYFYSNLNRTTIFKETVETLIRRRKTPRLIWVCTVCGCPLKWMLGLNGLNSYLAQSYYVVMMTGLMVLKQTWLDLTVQLTGWDLL